MALANFPGFTGRSAPSSGGPFIIHWPALIDSRHITEQVHFEGKVHNVKPTNQLEKGECLAQKRLFDIAPSPDGDVAEIAFGDLFGTRSGDKGGAANIGIWAKTDAAYAWLYHNLTPQLIKELMPDTAPYPVDRFDLPNVKALNFMIYGILGEGVAANDRIDGQAKTMGEYLRSRKISVPKSLLLQISAK